MVAVAVETIVRMDVLSLVPELMVGRRLRAIVSSVVRQITGQTSVQIKTVAELAEMTSDEEEERRGREAVRDGLVPLRRMGTLRARRLHHDSTHEVYHLYLILIIMLITCV
jgi:hypothetical protein